MARNIAVVTVACALLSTTALHAVTADEVWAAWQKEYVAYGFDISTGGQARQGDTLVLTKVHLSNTTEDAALEFDLPEVRLREQGDGTVEIRLARELTGKSRGTPAEGEPVEMDLHVTQTDSVAVVSGTPENLAYKVKAPVVIVDMTQVIAPATTESGAVDLSKAAEPLKMQLSTSGIEGEYHLEEREGRRLSSTMAVKSAQMTLVSPKDVEGRSVRLRGDFADLNSRSSTLAPEGTTLEDLNAALANGARIEASATYGAATWLLETENEKGLTTVSGAADAGDFAMTMAPEAIHYAVTAQAPKVKVQLPGVPVPFAGDLDATNFDVTFPMRKTDVPQPFAARLGLTNLRLSDEVWGLFDPQGKLPRSPATAVLDLAGKARPMIDLFSPEAATQQVPPMQIDSVSLNRLQLTAAGADLSGIGALTFDNAQEGPVPEGAIDLRLAGANALMDNLTAIQLVPQDQMMFVRMMLGLYAVPAGDDLYTSKIEFKTGGEILANGQRIR